MIRRALASAISQTDVSCEGSPRFGGEAEGVQHNYAVCDEQAAIEGTTDAEVGLGRDHCDGSAHRTRILARVCSLEARRSPLAMPTLSYGCVRTRGAGRGNVQMHLSGNGKSSSRVGLCVAGQVGLGL